MNFLFLPRFDFLALPPLPHSLFREHLSPPPLVSLFLFVIKKMTQLKPVSAASFAVSSPAPPQLVTPLRFCSCFLAATVPLALLEPQTLFTWHPTLLTFGFFGLGVQGILQTRNARPTDGSERVSLLWSHAAWQSGSAAAAVAGAWAIYENKVKEEASSYDGF